MRPLALLLIVIITAPETPRTQGLFRRARLRLLKPTAFLVNVGRGVVVTIITITGLACSDRYNTGTSKCYCVAANACWA